MKKIFGFIVLLFFTVGKLNAQETIPEALQKIKDMLLSTENYSADIHVNYYDLDDKLIEEETVGLYKSKELFYRVKKDNETLITKGKFLRIDHQSKEMLLISNKVEEFSMLLMGFDSRWMASKQLEILESPEGELKIRVPNYTIYKEIIFTFDKSNFCLKEIQYMYNDLETYDYSLIHVIYHNTKYGPTVADKSPVQIKDYIKYANGKWKSKKEGYQLINRIKAS